MIEIIHHGFRNEISYLDYEHAIFGSCKGVAMCRRGKNDNHVILVPLTEDDGTWHAGGGSDGFSSFSFLTLPTPTHPNTLPVLFRDLRF